MTQIYSLNNEKISSISKVLTFRQLFLF